MLLFPLLTFPFNDARFGSRCAVGETFRVPFFSFPAPLPFFFGVSGSIFRAMGPPTAGRDGRLPFPPYLEFFSFFSPGNWIRGFPSLFAKRFFFRTFFASRRIYVPAGVPHFPLPLLLFYSAPSSFFSPVYFGEFPSSKPTSPPFFFFFLDFFPFFLTLFFFGTSPLFVGTPFSTVELFSGLTHPCLFFFFSSFGTPFPFLKILGRRRFDLYMAPAPRSSLPRRGIFSGPFP